MTDALGVFRLERLADGPGGTVYRWTLISEFGQTIATSERFPDLDSAKKAAKWVRTRASKCEVISPPTRDPSIG